MNTTKEQQKELDDALVAPENRLKIGKSNLRLSSNLKSKEPAIQVVLDALKLTPFYNAFEISTDVPEDRQAKILNTLGKSKSLSDVNVKPHATTFRRSLLPKSHKFKVERKDDCSGNSVALIMCSNYFGAMYHNKQTNPSPSFQRKKNQDCKLKDDQPAKESQTRSESEEESWTFSQGEDEEEDKEHDSDDDNDDNDEERHDLEKDSPITESIIKWR
ncbi:hypothetical protein Tco_0146112 [Tanacetum coccineum]|uniref:Uncharacterized protein n=1 Tax=Tanacetum coccineum TaxID=301880 RepID=A0ABQ4Z460_9ASTR